jgi:hypothetical protein
MTRKTLAMLVVLWLGGVPVWASAVQEPTPPVLAQLEVEIVLSRYQGEQRVANLPYTLRVSEGRQRGSQLRVGVEVPLRTGEGGLQYRNVGTSVDCWANDRTGADDAHELRLSVDHSAVVPASDAEPPFQGAPMFSSFRLQSVVELRDGESAELVGSTDPVTGEVMRIRVSLKVR